MGTKIAISGRIQTGDYTDKNGNKVYTTEVVVEEQEFAESKKADGETAEQTPQPAPEVEGFMDIPKNVAEDLPFKTT